MSVDLDEMEEAENELEEWLVEQAENGIPEIVLIGLLRDYADDIEQLGYVPRMWGEAEDETNQLLRHCPQSEQADTILRRLLDASASLWNQLTYERRQRFFAGESVWDCDDYYDEYVDVLGSATTQQSTLASTTPPQRSFFETVEAADQEVSPPGYWGTKPTDGRDLRTYVRNDAYTIRGASALGLKCLSGASSKPSTVLVEPNDSPCCRPR